jgi:hypothetical protein
LGSTLVDGLSLSVLGAALKSSIFSVPLRDAGLCDAFLETAEAAYPDMLPTVRAEIAKAMGDFLVLHGYRGSVLWSDEDARFNGRVIGMPLGLVVEFSSHRPSEVQQAFVKAIRSYMLQGAARRKAKLLLLDQGPPLAVEQELEISKS